MKKTLLALLFAAIALPAIAVADTYQVTVGFTDGTAYNVGDAPTYSVKWRVNGGTETPITGLPTPGTAFSVVAAPGQSIDVAAQTRNKGLNSAWTGWATATASYPATQPVTPTGVTITVVHTGP